MGSDFYTNIGYSVVWCIKYIFIPLIVAIAARIITAKLLRPHPDRQKKKRFNKNRLK